MLNKIFYPKSIALIGASRTPGKLGYDILSNLKNLGFKGKLYPVNPKCGEILGLNVLADVPDLPEIPDLAIIAVPPEKINKVVEDCGMKGLKNLVIITAGFKEIGGEGAKREEELQKIIKKYGIYLIGPNCLGIINTEIKMNASFAEGMPQDGNVSLISQSGAMAVAMIDWAYESGLGFAKIISMGNKAGLSENELLEYLGNDSKTKVILMYLESIIDGKKFFEIAKRISLKKPIIIVKSGTSEAGNKAISSHTGSLAGSDTAVAAAFKQAGIIRANSIEELFIFAKAFSYQPLPQGNRVGIITNAGGPGIMVTDAIANSKHLVLAKIPESTQKKLAEGLPKTAALGNPVDLIGDALTDRYTHAISILLEEQSIDSLLVLLTPQVMTEVKKVATVTTALSSQYTDKTVISCFMGGENIVRGEHVFRRHRFPNYRFPENAVNALEKMYVHAKWRKNEKKRLNNELKVKFLIKNKKEVDDIFSKKRKAGERLETKEMEMIMDSYGINTVKTHLAKNQKEVLQYSNEIGYPVVMKISSPDIYHKTDVGGVMLNIKNDSDAKTAYETILKNVTKAQPQAKIVGVTVEPKLPSGREIIIGSMLDPNFGHLLMFGIGGIYVEIFKDVVFRVAPVSFDEALEMIQEIKAVAILQGVRGEKPVDLKEIADVIVRVSKLLHDYPQIKEFEINPLIISPKHGAVAVDTNCVV